MLSKTAKVIAAESYKANISFAFDALAAGVNPDPEPAVNTIEDIIGLHLQFVFKFVNLKASKKDSKVNFSSDTLKDPFQDLRSISQVYDLVFFYFFVAARESKTDPDSRLTSAEKAPRNRNYRATLL